MFSFLIKLIFILNNVSFSQEVQIIDINYSEYPKIKAKVKLFDRQNKPIQNLEIERINVIENGEEKVITGFYCGKDADPKPLSSVLTVDISGSMRFGNPRPMDLAKVASLTWVEDLNLNTSECAITAFDEKSYLIHEFSNQYYSLVNSIYYLEPGDLDTDYDEALLNPPFGSLEISKSAQFNPVIVFLTDGFAQFKNYNATKVEANRQNCVIYVVTLGMSCPQSLKDLTKDTGGKWFEWIRYEDEIKAVYKEILEDAITETEVCQIEWISDDSCDENTFNVEISYIFKD